MVAHRLIEPAFPFKEVTHRQNFLMAVSYLLRLGNPDEKIHQEGETSVQNHLRNQTCAGLDRGNVPIALFPAHHGRRIVRYGHELERGPGQQSDQTTHAARLLSIQWR